MPEARASGTCLKHAHGARTISIYSMHTDSMAKGKCFGHYRAVSTCLGHVSVAYTV